VSLAINTWGICGYHDELAPDREQFQGRFVIDAPRSPYATFGAQFQHVGPRELVPEYVVSGFSHGFIRTAGALQRP
jgi:hypothetical protein